MIPHSPSQIFSRLSYSTWLPFHSNEYSMKLIASYRLVQIPVWHVYTVNSLSFKKKGFTVLMLLFLKKSFNVCNITSCYILIYLKKKKKEQKRKLDEKLSRILQAAAVRTWGWTPLLGRCWLLDRFQASVKQNSV